IKVASRYSIPLLLPRRFHIKAAHDGPTALQLVSKEMPRLIALDMDLQGMGRPTVVRKLRAKQYTGGIIMLSNTEDETLVNLAIDMGSVDILGKPVDPERLAVALQVGMLLRMKDASETAEVMLKCPNGHEGQMTPMQTERSEGASSP